MAAIIKRRGFNKGTSPSVIRTLIGIEFGTFTPTMTFGTPGDLSVTYAEQTGWYTRIPSARVLFGVRINFTPTHTTASGNLLIGGLPYAGSGSWDAAQVENSANITYPAGRTACIAQVLTSTTTCRFMAVGSAVNNTPIIASNVGSGVATFLGFTGAYLTT